MPTTKDAPESSGMDASLKLKAGPRARVQQGHPWVYESEVKEPLPPEFDGQAVPLRDARNRFLGMGIYNSRSQILWRRYTREKNVPFDANYLEAAIQAAVARRTEQPFRRLVWSDADHLPGLIVDQFEDVLVVQAVTRAVDERLDEILGLLGKLLSPSEIVVRNDAPSRKQEGLDSRVFTRSGDRFAARWFSIDGFEYFLDLERGHKTGFYLDQREQHPAVGALAKGRRVLDLFCNQGAFSLHCAAHGATKVVGVDESEECIQLAKMNAGKNRQPATFVAANAFDYLTNERSQTYDLIVCDPPSFARNKRSINGALRGYKELNLRAFQMLSPGGILATYSCSQHVDTQHFYDIVLEALADARRNARVLSFARQAADHPILLNMPESWYLKGLVLEVE